MSGATYITVIGLEVHVQLKTRTKLFCRCSTEFGAAPNTQTCPVCIGMPGSLPVMNRHAFDLALKTALALHCEIPAFTKWDRKNYYYPDLPKGYQISQYDLPMSRDGYLDIRDPKGRFPDRRVRIIRAHLEEDAGKSMHDEVAGKADSRIDLNRTGTPLLEIVTHPDLRSPDEAKAYLTELKLLLSYLDVSDCNMQEGSLRVDANINLHIDTPQGTVATPIVEIKNMNSFRAVERALAYEAERQYQEWRETGQTLGEGAQADARLGRSGTSDAGSAAQRGVQRLPLFSRPRPGARASEPRGDRRRTRVAGRTAGGTAESTCVGVRTGSLRCRRAGQSRSGPRGLFRTGSGPLPGSQTGQQLDPARRAPHAQ